MRISKKFLFVSILLLSSTSAHCMFDDEEKLILVHASNVLLENNTKIAGAQFRTIGDETQQLDLEGTKLRTRITLHHGLGGMVPREKHGVEFYDVKLDSHLYTNKDVCGYLDPLTAFRGEIFGGVPSDFMTIDRHTYGQSSTIIIPHHKVDEFHAKNPDYKGKLVPYDPETNSIKEKIDEVIGEISGAPRFTDINAVENISEFLRFCSKNKYFDKMHSLSTFRLLEQMFKEVRQTIYTVKQGKMPKPLPADQVEPLTTVVYTLLQDIHQQLIPTLSKDKMRAIEDWIVDTDSWFNLFQVDADLRIRDKKSLFLNNMCFNDTINHRHDRDYLYSLSKSLPCIQSELDLNITGKKLFLDETIVELTNAPFELILKLQKQLINRNHLSHGNGLLLIHLMKQINKSIQKNDEFIDKEELFFSTLNNIITSDQIKYHLIHELEDILTKDKSFRNKNFLSQLNSPAGKALRQKIWGDDSNLDFWILLKTASETAILFKDLENEDFGYGFSKPLSLACRRFTEIVRQWLLERALNSSVYIPGCTALILAHSQPKTMVEELKDPHFSIFNFHYAKEIATKLSHYTIHLHRDVRDPNNSLQALIDQGCFKSWGDLVSQLYDLRELDENDLSNILKQEMRNISIINLGIKINGYLTQLQVEQECFDAYKPIYEMIAQRIATAGERTIEVEEVDSFWDNGLERYIDLLNQCIHGYTREIGKNKVTILPNWEQATILYKRLYGLANYDEKIKLDKMMESIFNTK